jgi:hypothetical protein
MAVPDFQSLMLPLLKLVSDGQQHTLAEAVERLAQEFQLSDDDRTQLLRSGQTRIYNRVAWTSTYLRKANLLHAVGPGRFQLTERGREVLASMPRTFGNASWRLSTRCVASSARSTRHVSARRPPGESRRPCLNAIAKVSHVRSALGPRVRRRSASSTTYTSLSYRPSCSRATSGQRRVVVSARRRTRSNGSRVPSARLHPFATRSLTSAKLNGGQNGQGACRRGRLTP